MTSRSEIRKCSRTGFLSAFTVVELLVVIGIITVLVAILLPALAQARRQVLRLQCSSNLHQIVLAAFSYAADCHGALPYNRSAAPFCIDNKSSSGGGWIENRPMWLPYLGDPRVLYCPTGDNGIVPGTPDEKYIAIQKVGWNGSQIDPPTGSSDRGYFVTSSYAIFGSWVQAYNGDKVRTLVGADDPIPTTVVPGYGTNLPQLPAKLGNAKDSSRLPFAADFAGLYNTSTSTLSSLKDGPFYVGEWATGVNTAVWCHYDDPKGFEGLNAAFYDGHVEWRPRGVAGPRLNLNMNNPSTFSGYQYILWY